VRVVGVGAAAALGHAWALPRAAAVGQVVQVDGDEGQDRGEREDEHRRTVRRFRGEGLVLRFDGGARP